MSKKSILFNILNNQFKVVLLDTLIYNLFRLLWFLSSVGRATDS